MDQAHQIAAFENDLEKLIHRYAHEFSLSWAAVIGVLEMAKAGVVEAATSDEK